MNKIKIACFVLALSLVLSGCGQKKVAVSPNPTQRPRKQDVNVNLEPLENRPYVTLAARNDGHAIEVSINQIKKKAQDVEYDVEYSAGTLLEGAFGDIDLTKGATPYTTEVLLGSCSTGGKCTWNTQVTGGTMTFRFGTPDFTLKNEFSFADVNKVDTVYTSRDGKFLLDTSKAKVGASQVLVYQDPGYPGQLQGQILAGPYAVSANGTGISGTVKVTMRVPSISGKPTIFAYDGKTLAEVPTTIDAANQEVSTLGTLNLLYLVVSK